MKHEAVTATAWGAFFTAATGALILAGSRRLQHFDAALVAYTFATLFAVFAIVYRYAMWLQRPPTRMYWKRGWEVFFRPRYLGRNLAVWVRRLVANFALNIFIFRRGFSRWAAHWLTMWGCVIAALITFPLVFGWIHFQTPPGDFEHYRVYVFGFPTMLVRIDSLLSLFVFHGLVWSAFLVIAGVMLAMRRRMRERGLAATQQFGEDILPLILLFAVSITGLLIWVSYKWMHGYAYEFLAILHAITVIFTLLWLPFGKFFHIFQRPAQLGVAFYKDVGAREEQAACIRCGEPFASRMHMEDLAVVEKQLGYCYELPERGGGHYQRVCPECRRVLFALAQGDLFRPAPKVSER